MNWTVFAIVISMSFNFAFFIAFMAAGKEWLYYFKKYKWRKKGIQRVIIIDKSGVVRDKFEKVGEDVKVDPDKELIGAYLGKPVHYDAVFGMPVRFVVEGNMSDSDLLELFNRNAILKKFFEKNPNLKLELENVIINHKKDGKEVGKTNLLNFVYDANLNAEYSPTKHQDFLSSVGVRLYNTGVTRGLKSLQAVGSLKWLWLGLLGLGLLLIILLVMVSKINGNLSDLTAAINALKTTIPTVIGK